jgi:hypothetical protein
MPLVSLWKAKNDASDPAKFNFGYESHTAVVVPPKKPLHSNEQWSQDSVPEGDLLSTLSTFSMLNEKPTANATKPELTIRTGVATGRAAKAIADQLQGTASSHAQSNARTARTNGSGLLQRMQEIASQIISKYLTLSVREQFNRSPMGKSIKPLAANILIKSVERHERIIC